MEDSVIKEQKIGKKTYVVDQELDALAKEVIEQHGLVVGDADIVYMKVYPNVSNTVAGRCIRSSRELKFFSDCDYIIQMSGDLWDALDEHTRRVLMLHELMHIFIDEDNEGNPVYKLRKHDVEDFAAILDVYGVNWLYDLRQSANEIDKKVDPLKIRM
jgi:hypothetical protein